MAASVNKVILMGNVGQDPDLKYTQQGIAFCKFSLATSEYDGQGPDGKAKYRAEWHNIVLWGKPAETAGKHLKKGDMAHLFGKKQTVEYTKDNSDQKFYRTEILADHLIPLPRAVAAEHPVGNYGLPN